MRNITDQTSIRGFVVVIGFLRFVLFLAPFCSNDVRRVHPGYAGGGGVYNRNDPDVVFWFL